MALNQAQIDRLTSSFQAVEPQLDLVVSVFYGKLFETAPAIRSMFPDDLGKQKQHMVSALMLVAKNIPNIENLAVPLREMGARHVGYGAEEAHFPVVRNTMVFALGEVAGYIWTQQIADDWSTALDAIAGYMIEGMNESKAKAA